MTDNVKISPVSISDIGFLKWLNYSVKLWSSSSEKLLSNENPSFIAFSYVPGTVAGTLNILPFKILTIIRKDKHYFSHFPPWGLERVGSGFVHSA